MKSYSISDLENHSGIKAHTLRTWEVRYGILKPERNGGNFRVYTLADLTYLLNLRLLNNAGFKISKLAKMSQPVLQETIESLGNEKIMQRRQIHQLIINMVSMEPHGFEQVLNDCQFTWGIDVTVSHIIVPFIEQMRLFSCKNCPLEIDLILPALRQKLILGIEQTIPVETREKIVLLFLPEGEHYDLLLLYCRYLIKQNGLKTLYLGTNISFTKIKEMMLLKQPDYLLTYVSPRHKHKIEAIQDCVSKDMPQAQLFFATFKNHLPFNPANTIPVLSPDEMLQAIY